MGIINAGRVRIGWKGSWDPLVSYIALDAVEYEGSSYVCTEDTTPGIVPVNVDFWQLMAERGDKGADGLDGATGPRGPEGPQGMVGPQGTKGDKGDVGPVGPEGPQGMVGPQGTKGDQGLTGPAGPEGPQGPQGLQGIVGPEGDRGPVGPAGPQGPKGIKGDEGSTGPTGPVGPSGPAGPEGPQGPQGLPVSIDSGDGLLGGGLLDRNRALRVAGNVVRTFGEQNLEWLTINGVEQKSGPVSGALKIRTNNNSADYIVTYESSGGAQRFTVRHGSDHLEGTSNGPWLIDGNEVLCLKNQNTIGSYAFLVQKQDAWGNAPQFGDTRPASKLAPTDTFGNDEGGNLSGTWRCMGGTTSYVSGFSTPTLWQRIS